MRRQLFLKLTNIVACLVVIFFTATLTNIPLKRAQAQTTYDGPTIQKWIDALSPYDDNKKLRIIYDNNTPNSPPIVVPEGKKFISPDTGSGRPPIIFKLAAASFNTTYSTVKWLIFQGYQVDNDGKNPQVIPNFYFLMNDCSDKNVFGSGSSAKLDCFDIIYDTDQAKVYQGIFNSDSAYPTGAVLINGNTSGLNIFPWSNIGGIVISHDDINKIFGYVMNVPKDGSENCRNGGVWTTGPPGTADAQTVQEIQGNSSKFPSVFSGAPSNLDSTCGSSSGWLSYWGVSAVNNQTQNNSDCSITKIIGAGDIGTIFSKLVTCLVTSIFTPIVTWAADLVKTAAGISYETSPRRLAFISRGYCT